MSSVNFEFITQKDRAAALASRDVGDDSDALICFVTETHNVMTHTYISVYSAHVHTFLENKFWAIGGMGRKK